MHLSDYLNKSALNREFPLSDNGLLSFHWSNWFKTCQLQQQLKENLYNIDQSQENSEKERPNKFSRLNSELEDLKRWRVWIKGRRKVVESSIYDIYQAYLDPRFRYQWFDATADIQISIHHETGPYISLSSMRWMDKSIYASFVRQKILEDKVMLRSFRLSMKIPVHVYFNDTKLRETYMTLYQASSQGVLIKVHDRPDLLQLLRSKKININIPLVPFIKGQKRTVSQALDIFSSVSESELKDSSLIAMTLSSDILSRYGNMANLQASDGKSYCFFAHYNDFEVAGNYRELKHLHPLRDLVMRLEQALDEEIQAVDLKRQKKAA